MLENVGMVQAVLAEIREAMLRLLSEGTTHMIYVGSTGLNEEEQVELLESLGRGDITITFTETDQPVTWYESQFRGVWIGTYKNQRDEASVYTIEVCRYPQVAASFDEDIKNSASEMQEWVLA